jgi:peptide/nickel transport system permease protein
MSRSVRFGAVARRTAWQVLPTVIGIVVLHQLWSYLTHLAHFSLGYSPRYDAPVMQLILSRLPNTLLLMGVALTFAIAVGVTLGAVMAHWVGRWPDRVLSVLALLFYSTPGFWIGLLAIVLFSVHLGWLPSGGNVTLGVQLHGFAVLRNALMPLTTMVGIHFGTLLGGAAVTETVFSWPGLGRLALDAVMARDFSVLLGVLLLSSLLVIVANVLVDLLQAWLDPRIA